MGIFDQAQEAMGQLWGSPNELIQMVGRLPDVLGDAGQQMHDAGVGADVAADLLTNDMLELANSSADLLGIIHRNTATIAHLLGDLGDRISRVPLMGDLASPFTQALRTMREMSDNLERVSNQVRDLGTGLSAVGEGLGAMATSLKGSGTALAAVSGHKIQKRSVTPTPAALATDRAARTAKAASATARRTAAKKTTATKRAQAKKTPAKRATPRKKA